LISGPYLSRDQQVEKAELTDILKIFGKYGADVIGSTVEHFNFYLRGTRL
jgi:hypothetical protein